MSDPRHVLGHAAEAAVATWLTSAGWTVLARRFRARTGGEVDLIALDPTRTMVGIEVRARRSARAGAAATTVDVRRVRRIEATLVAFAAAAGSRHAGLRVDLVAVELVPGLEDERWRLTRLPGVGER